MCGFWLWLLLSYSWSTCVPIENVVLHLPILILEPHRPYWLDRSVWLRAVEQEVEWKMRKYYSKSLLIDFPRMLHYSSIHQQPFFPKIADQHILSGSPWHRRQSPASSAWHWRPCITWLQWVSQIPNRHPSVSSHLSRHLAELRPQCLEPSSSHLPSPPSPLSSPFSELLQQEMSVSLLRALSHMGHILNEWFHACVIYLTNQTRTPQIGGPWVEFSPHTSTCFAWPTQCFWRIWISCQHF